MQRGAQRILTVDDDEAIRRLLRGLLEGEYEVAEAATGEHALEMLPAFPAQLVMLDVMLPGIDGRETCRRIRAGSFGRGIQVMMVSGESSREDRAAAYEAGADDYMVKPFEPHELRSRIRLHFRLRRALDTITSAACDGRSRLGTSRRFTEPRLEDMSQILDTAVEALTRMAEFREMEPVGHLVRTCSYCQILAEELGRHGPYAHQIDEQFLEDLYWASPLHDVGKVGLAGATLLRPGPLRPHELESMRQHTTIGANILEHAAMAAPDVRFLPLAATIARFHHERFDGSGYPAELAGSEIPLPARIVALSDAYEAITSVRPCQVPLPAPAAREIVERESGRRLDPVVVEAFRQRFDTMVSVQRQLQEPPPVVVGANSFLREHLVAVGQ